ncbi:MAG: patatin-like phospholipase family protein [Isosphaeraceae bacterium]
MLSAMIVVFQYAAALALVLWLLWYYRTFLGPLYRFLSTFLGLTTILLLLYLLVYAQLGASYGLPYLFWHEDALSRVSASTGATLLLALIGLTAFYLDPYPLETGLRTRDWLAADEAIRTSLVKLWRRLGRDIIGLGGKLITSVGLQGPRIPARGQVPMMPGDTPAEAIAAWQAASDAGESVEDAKAAAWRARQAARRAYYETRQGGARRRARAASRNAERARRGAARSRLAARRAGNMADGLVAAAAAAESVTSGRDAARQADRYADEAEKIAAQADQAARSAAAAAERDEAYRADLGRVRFRDGLAFLMGASLFDWMVVFPPQVFLEPRSEDVRRLHRFLRTCRTPFLLLLLAPALLPTVFSDVPRAAPAMPSWYADSFGAPPPGTIFDVGQTWQGWRDGVVAWVAGIVLGVTIVKLFLRLSEMPYGSNIKVEESLPGRRTARCAQEHCPLQGCPYGHASDVGSRPHPCRARRELRESIAIFFGCVFAFYVIIGNVPMIYDDLVSPAFAICAALGVMALLIAFIALQERRWQVPLVLLLVAYIGYANNNPYKTQFENNCYDDARLVRLRERVAAAYLDGNSVAGPGAATTDPDLVDDRVAREGWLAERQHDTDLVGGKPKLVLVAVSGGAARSAYWTATVLDRLEREISGFGAKVRVISGASGGMLGAACYVVHRRDHVMGIEGDPWVGRVPTNSLKPLAKFIALSEIWQSLYPARLAEDRGVALERDWKALRFPLHDLRELERIGRIPSLIFSPMIVEDGRRLLISNLDLGRSDDSGRPVPSMVMTRGHLISDTSPGEKVGGYSLSALEYYRLFPEARCLYLSTAVRMSASFPYVSPAVNLPTDPPRRVVDAGYYDNYGIEVATAWIYRNRGWLAEKTSGVLLLQVRDSVSVKERLDVDDAKPTLWQAATRGFQFFTSPIDGFGAARTSSSSFRNDHDVEFLGDVFEGSTRGHVAEPQRFFTTVVFENSASVTLNAPLDWPDPQRLKGDDDGDGARDVSMTWYLTRDELRSIRAAIPADPPEDSIWRIEKNRRSLIDDLYDQVFKALPPGPKRDVSFKRLEGYRNYERLQMLKRWWSEAGKPLDARNGP